MHIKSRLSLKADPSRFTAQKSAIGVTVPGKTSEIRSFWIHSLLFVLIGLLLYLGLYLVAEQLTYQYTVRNRFFAIKTAPHSEYDYVILGASRAAVLDYDDMNAHLEEETGARILNLSTLGGGVTVNRLLLDYFLAGHQTKNVVYFLDSFAFYSPEWNEERVQDVQLLQRAPLDPVLVWLLIKTPETRAVAPGYLLGFYKINNPDRFKSDISEEEVTRFDKTYRPVKQIDRQRLAYLYPEQIAPATFQRYLAEFETMVRELRQQDINVIVIKAPIPERVYQMLPAEQQFDEAVKNLLRPYEASFHDFSLVSNDEKFFFNTDHLNRTGVQNFCEGYLKDVLALNQ